MWPLRSPSVRRKLIGGMLIGLVLLASVTAVLLLRSHQQPQPPNFESLDQFTDFARRHGLFVHSGSNSPEISGLVCYVADYPISGEEVGQLNLSLGGLTPAWKGVACGVLQSETIETQTNALDGHWRVWGNLVVAGDPDFLDRLERLYQDH